MEFKKYFLPSFIIVILIVNFSCSVTEQPEGNRTLLFDDNWRFIKDNPQGAENPLFDDSNWRLIDLPHDWSIEDLPDQTKDRIVGPFSKASNSKMRTGYTLGGTAWYRKSFTIDNANKDKIAYLQFDGVYMNADIWINGKHIGDHPYGYTSFYYDITSYLNPAGQLNVVAVQVKNEGLNARWYSGSGIYRHTWLTLVDKVHIGVWGVFVTTPDVSEKLADVEINTNLINSGKQDAAVTLSLEIVDPAGNVVGTAQHKSSIIPGSSNDIRQKLTIENPIRWSTENPKLYQAKVSIFVNNKKVDHLTTTFGIRKIHFDAQAGFTLNGKNMKLKGGCFHHDNGPLGSAAIDRAEERKIEIFKNAGYNAIRCSHNPPSPYLLDVCDQLGILVINEIFDNWEDPKVSEDDYSKSFNNWWQKDIESWILRDRNHPSVIMWSIGNEIHEALDTAGFRIAKNLTAAIRNLDNTRAVTEGFNDFARRRGQKSRWHDSAPHLELLDVVGYNYMYDRYLEDHEKYPDRVMAATEFMPLYSLANWKTVEDYSYVIGNFAWVVMDYLGEAGVGLSRIVPEDPAGDRGLMGFFSRESWPIFNDFQGDIDLIGNKKPRYFHQLVVWRKSNIEMMVHEPIPAGMKENVSPWGWPEELKCWNWEGHEGKKMQVHVYTRSPLVTLELNGKKIGKQSVEGDTSITATFEVPYEPGVLIARSYADGVETGVDTLKTFGKPAAIRLVADRTTIKADRNDLSYVMVEIIDHEGNVIPNADSIMVNFEVSGNGEIAGVGSGSPTDMASFQQPQRRTWHGRCLVIIRPEVTPGTINITAKSDGLKESSLEISAE